MKVVRETNGNFNAIIDYFKNNRLSVGFFETAKYPDGTPVAYVAAINDLGSPANNIPARPFWRNSAKENSKAWNELFAKGINATVNGRITPAVVLERMGLKVAGDIQKSIIDGTYAPLKQSTLDAKQAKKRTAGVSAKPLIDTSLMLKSVTYAVEVK